MTDDRGFMQRDDWLENEKPFCKVFCPVSSAERQRRLTPAERRAHVFEAGEEGSNAMAASALAIRYDWPLHQMVAYMRRLDGATRTIRKHPRMDPLAKRGEPKWAIDGKLTPFFNYWAFVAWDEVFAPVLSKLFGVSVAVLDEEDVDVLLDTTVMM